MASSEITLVAEAPRAYYSTPIWSPDGAFVAAILVGESFEATAVLISLADGSEVEVASSVMAIAGWRP